MSTLPEYEAESLATELENYDTEIGHNDKFKNIIDRYYD